MYENEKFKLSRELSRWVVFLSVIIPALPLAIIALILGALWTISKTCFLAGASTLDVYDVDET